MTSATNRTTTCRGCGQQVLFVTTKDGVTVPLDVVAAVYTRVWDPDSDKGFWMREETGETFVSHFATCAKANQFSGRNRLTPR